MIAISSIVEVQKQIEQLRQGNKSIGFVPTMGALHKGHISLVEQCKNSCDYTVVSIFVNPTQFNDKEDLRRYPRMPEKDCEMLENAGCNIVFLPTEEEVYPTPDTRVFEFGELDKVMEGAFRPGHFNGVAQVVSRLFDIIKPNKAFFGQKDFQQLAIIQNMVQQLAMPVNIIPCPIVREADGLAMSSRNMLLATEQRMAAPNIYQALQEAQGLAKEQTPNEVKERVTKHINSNNELKTEYVELVNAHTLQPVSTWNDADHIQLCVAVRVGKIRLIDNIQLK